MRLIYYFSLKLTFFDSNNDMLCPTGIATFLEIQHYCADNIASMPVRHVIAYFQKAHHAQQRESFFRKVLVLVT